MNANRLQQFMSDYGHALGELEEAAGWTDIDKPHRDSTILRFVLVYEVAWKTLTFALAEVGPEVDTARDAFRQAYRRRWITRLYADQAGPIKKPPIHFGGFMFRGSTAVH